MMTLACKADGERTCTVSCYEYREGRGECAQLVGALEPTPELLTVDERAVVQLAGELWNALCAVIPEGPTRDADLGEAIVHVHALQHQVMSNAAARAYPDEFRLLGGTLR